MKKRKLNQINLRAWIILFIIIGLGFTAVIARLFKLQVIDGAGYKAKALQQGTGSRVIEPQRGTIYDRNGKVLAQSATVWNVFISPAEMDEKEIPAIAKRLSEILDITEESVLKAAENKKSYYEKIKSKIDSQTKEKVEEYIKSGEKNIKGIYHEEDIKRYYVFDNLASTLIGFTTSHDNRGAYGLESYYDSVLSGTPGVIVSSTNAKNIYMNSSNRQYYESVDGNSIVLTIDETLQAILEKHLEMAVIEHSIENKAAGILLNIKTGEVLAMATKPDFNLNAPYDILNEIGLAELETMVEGSDEYKKLEKDLRYDQWRNKAISDPYEPGSVYKILTMSMALEENKSFLQDSFYCSGSIVVADRTVNCWRHSGHGAQDFFGIVRNSCNPAFVTLGQRIGGEKTHEYMTDFGLGKVTGIDLPGEAEGILHSVNRLSNISIGGEVQLASTSFGQSFKTTPIQLITAVSAAVNGGYLVEPYVVKQIMDPQNNVVKTIHPNIKRQVISEATSDKVKLLVEEVVANGSGRHAAVPGYRIGGKTGTSEKLDLLPEKKYVLSFVGFAPMEDPTYACLVLLDEPAVSNPWGSVIAAPVVGAILQESLSYLGVEAHFTQEQLSQTPAIVPGLIGAKPHDAQAELTSLGLRTKIIGKGGDVIRQVPLSGTSMPKGSQITIYTEEEMLNANLTVPDLKDLGVEQAVEQLMNMGLNFQIQSGTISSTNLVVGSQWPEAGEKIKTADIVAINLIRPDTGEEVVELPPSVPPVITQEDSAYQDDTIAEDEVQDTNLEPEDVAPEAKEAPVKEEVKEEEPVYEPPVPEKGATGEVLDS